MNDLHYLKYPKVFIPKYRTAYHLICSHQRSHETMSHKRNITPHYSHSATLSEAKCQVAKPR